MIRPRTRRSRVTPTPADSESTSIATSKAHQEDKEPEDPKLFLSLLCNEELLPTPGNSPPRESENFSMADPATPKEGNRRPSSSSSTSTSVFKYSLATDVSHEMGQLIFGLGRDGAGLTWRALEARRKRRKLENDEPNTFADSGLDHPPLPLLSSSFISRRPVTPDHHGKLFYPSKEEERFWSTPSPTHSMQPSESFSIPLPYPAAGIKVMPKITKSMSEKDTPKPRKRKLLTLPVMQDLYVPMKQEYKQQYVVPPPPQPVPLRTTSGGLQRTSTTATTMTAATSASTLTTSAGVVAPPGWWANGQELQADHGQAHEERPLSRIFDDCLSEDGMDEDDDGLSWTGGLMNPRDLEPDTSVYMCDREPARRFQRSFGIPVEIIAKQEQYDTQQQQRFSYSTQAPAAAWPPMQQQQQQPAPPTAMSAFNDTRMTQAPTYDTRWTQAPHTDDRLQPSTQSACYGRRTRASLIDDEQQEDPMVNCGNEFLENPMQFQHSHSLVPPPLMEKASSSLFNKPTALKLGRTRSIRDDDFGGLLSHILVQSPHGLPLQHYAV